MTFGDGDVNNRARLWQAIGLAKARFDPKLDRLAPMTPIATLLLVDDDRHLLDSMAAWLREQQYEVHTAAGMRDATGILDTRKLDLVLADIRLADGDGFAILARCRKLTKQIAPSLFENLSV